MAFDLLRLNGSDKTALPLRERLFFLESAFLTAANPHLDLAETHTQEKALFHELTLTEGKEGTVWKKFDQPYLPGRRVRHWLKRKKALEVEAEVSGFEPGTAGKGNENLVGAVEFSVRDGHALKPIAWMIRRFAFRYSESSYGHWLPLMFADRVGEAEGVVQDLASGRVPNVFAERGWNAEWKYNREKMVGRVVVGAVLATAAVGLIVGLWTRDRTPEQLADGAGI